jgi:glycosyltransferase involved in cell wall biosynthesis
VARRVLERAGSRGVAKPAQPGARHGSFATAMLELAHSGPARLSSDRPDSGAPLKLAAVVPSFRRGSGGHRTIVRLLCALRDRGHEVSAWLSDVEGRHAAERSSVTKRSFDKFFAADGVPLETDPGNWRGADVVLATGWQTVARALLLPGAAARAYLVQDHEPDFYGASAEGSWAAHTYTQGLHCIAASAWLAELLRARYGASSSHFELAVEHDIYRPLSIRRREDLVIFYARSSTPRRAVPLGVLALEELSRRRPELEIAMFGETRAPAVPFAHHDLGVLDPSAIADLYSRATVGVVLSLTNPSLVGLEMMACGLPCVELASDSMRATFGERGPLVLARSEPLALCERIEGLLADPGGRETRAASGLELMAGRTWSSAAEQVEEGLRLAIEHASAAPAVNPR